MIHSMRKRWTFVPLMLILLAAVVFAGGQQDLEVAIPPAFVEQRGEEWVEEFRAQLLEQLAATTVATDAVHLMLRFASVRDLPTDPGEAAGRLTQAIQFADKGLRRGAAPAAVTAGAVQSVGSGRGPARAAVAPGRGRSNAPSARGRVERILEDVKDAGRPASVPGSIFDGIESGAPPGQTDDGNLAAPPDRGRPDR